MTNEHSSANYEIDEATVAANRKRKRIKEPAQKHEFGAERTSISALDEEHEY